MKWNKKKYDSLYRKYSLEKYISSDPIDFCRKSQNPHDAELIAFVSSLFAYGNVGAMKKFLTELFRNSQLSTLEKLLSNKKFEVNSLYYRFQKREDIITIIHVLKDIAHAKHHDGSFLFESIHTEQNKDLKFRIDFLREALWNSAPLTRQTPGFKQLVGYGGEQSARKRYCMFFRWMTRKTFPDLGLYTAVKPEQLIVPLDTHIMRISLLLGLRTRNTPDWKTAVEVTENLKKIDPEDPLKYDFSLTRPGILKEFSSLHLETA